MDAAMDWIKPQMVQQALSSTAFCEEYGKASRESRDHKFLAASKIMKELLPHSTGCGSNPTAKSNIATLRNSSSGRSAYTTPPCKPSTSQLTIFYNGSVNVYNVVEKQAEAIIRLAGNEMNSQQLDSRPPWQRVTISSTSTINETEELFPLNPSENSAPQQVLIQKFDTDLPLQRKQSLQRFLQKRKEYRTNRADPYSNFHTHTQSWLKKAVDYNQKSGLTLIGTTSLNSFGDILQ